MEKKIFINQENMRDEMRKMREERFGPMREHMRTNNEVKLFTDKNEMVTYVNQLTGIENVEIFKIEDNLYKVLVSRRKAHEGCCKDHHE